MNIVITEVYAHIRLNCIIEKTHFVGICIKQSQLVAVVDANPF